MARMFYQTKQATWPIRSTILDTFHSQRLIQQRICCNQRRLQRLRLFLLSKRSHSRISLREKSTLDYGLLFCVHKKTAPKSRMSTVTRALRGKVQSTRVENEKKYTRTYGYRSMSRLCIQRLFQADDGISTQIIFFYWPLICQQDFQRVNCFLLAWFLSE